MVSGPKEPRRGRLRCRLSVALECRPLDLRSGCGVILVARLELAGVMAAREYSHEPRVSLRVSARSCRDHSRCDRSRASVRAGDRRVDRPRVSCISRLALAVGY